MMRQFPRKGSDRVLLLIAAVQLFAVSALAAFEETVASTVHGGTPYLLVIEEQSGTAGADSSARVPGIYVRDASVPDALTWLPSVLGRVMPVPVRGGILQQLGISNHTNRFESLTVVDGKLYLFSVKSRPEAEGTTAVLGEGAFAVVDLVDGTTVALPPILSTDDVVIQQRYNSDGTQIVLVSLRAPTPKGDGITLAFTLRSDANRSDVLVPAFRPVVLDWNFLPAAQLAQRVMGRELGPTGPRANNTFLYSSALLRRYVSGGPNEPLQLRRWRDMVRALANGGSSAAALTAEQRRRLPLIDGITGELSVAELPYAGMPQRSRDFALISVFDPITGNREAVYAPGGAWHADGLFSLTPVASGRAACDASGCMEAHEVSLDDGTFILLRMEDGRLYIVGKLDNTENTYDSQLLRPVGRSSPQSAPTAISWTHVPHSNTLLVSWQFADGTGLTMAYQVALSDFGVQLQGAVTVAQRSFTTAELRLRLSWPRGPAQPLFDAFTTVAEGGDYTQVHRLTTPHIDLVGSIKENALAVVFPQPLQTIPLDQHIEYRVYETQGGYSDLTGVYQVLGSEEKLLKKGRIIDAPVEQPSPRRALSDAPAVQEVVNVNVHRFGELRMRAMFLDRRGRGNTAVDPVLLINSFQNEKIADVHSIGGGLDISGGVRYFRAFPLFSPLAEGDRGEQRLPLNWLYVISLKDGPTFAYVVNIQEADGELGVNVLVEHTLSEVPLELPEVQARLRFDGTGGSYFVTQTDKEETEATYELLSLTNGYMVYPNHRNSSVRQRYQTFDEYNRVSTPDPGYSSRGAAWRVWSHDRRVQEQAARLRAMPDYQNDIFPQARDLHDELADVSRRPRRVVLLVPPELIPYFEGYSMALRARESNAVPHWNSRRSDFALYNLDKSRASLQEEVINVLTHMRDEGRAGRTRPVLLSSIETVREVGAPKLTMHGGAIDGFMIEESQIAGPSSTMTGDPSLSEETLSRSSPPSMAYWLATEGRQLPLPAFRDSNEAPTYSTLLIGTEEDWTAMLASAPLETSFALAEKFEVVRLQPLARATRESYVLSLFDRPEVRALGYTFSANNLVTEGGEESAAVTSDEARLALASYLVNRTERLCTTNGMPIYQGFLRVLNLLGHDLTTNPRLRRERVLSRATVETLLSKVFPMTLNINLLGPQDPLSILYRHEEGQKPGDEAVFQWHLAGYYGDAKLKRDVINTILSQLQSNDAKPVSSSMIIIGGSGTGKTYLVTTLLYEVLKLKPYRMEASVDSNADAWVFFLPMSRVYDDSTANTPRTSGGIPLSEALKHLDQFLALPNGYRGFLVFDDMHLAPPTVRQRFISKIRSFQDSPTYSITSNGRTIEYPTRNLTPIITMNPTDNQERLNRFKNKDSAEATEMDKILATLSSGDGSNDIDRSFVRRFGRIVDLSEFPAEAKAPQLAVKSRGAAQTILENDSKFVVVSDAAVQLMSTHFAKVDARSFLSAATNALTVPARSRAGSTFIVLPRPETEAEGAAAVGRTSRRFEASGVEAISDIEQFGESRTQLVTLDGSRDFRGKVAMTHFLAENFRRNVYRILLRSLYLDHRFARGRDSQQFWGAPIMQALHDHLSQQRALDVESLGVEPRDLGYTGFDEAAQLRRAMHTYSLEQQIVATELPFMGASRASSAYDQFLGRGTGAARRTRGDVMRQTSDEVAGVLETLLAENIRVPNVRQLPANQRAWLTQLDSDAIDLIDVGGEELVGAVVRFISQIDARSINAEGAGPLSNYEAMRLFFMVLDQSMARMPWGRVTEHMTGVLRAVTTNAALAQLPPVQNYLFEDRASLMVSQDLATMLLLAEGFPFFEGGDGLARRVGFGERCKAWLEPKTPTAPGGGS